MITKKALSHNKQTAVTAYFLSNQLPQFAFARQSW